MCIPTLLRPPRKADISPVTMLPSSSLLPSSWLSNSGSLFVSFNSCLGTLLDSFSPLLLLPSELYSNSFALSNVLFIPDARDVVIFSTISELLNDDVSFSTSRIVIVAVSCSGRKKRKYYLRKNENKEINLLPIGTVKLVTIKNTYLNDFRTKRI